MIWQQGFLPTSINLINQACFLPLMRRYVLLIVIILLGFSYYQDLDFSGMTGSIVASESYVQDQGSIQVYFCPREGCETAFTNFISTAEESVHCALFDIGLPSVQEVLLSKERQGLDVKVVTDNDYIHKFTYDFVREDSWGLMHDKFCIIDGKKISTGSMNPTNNGVDKNNNNLLLIDSKTLAQNYDAEFQEMWDGDFKKGEPVQNPSVKLDGVKIENYFCPEDHCAAHIKEELQKAETSIHLLTFSFTNDGIGDMILLKHRDGILIRGVMEARQVTDDSEYDRIIYQDMDVLKDGNPNNMHHKVFIIDGKTVITGSMNPTGSGDERNDENILIIHDEKIAQRFLQEFEYVYKEAEGKQN